MRHGFLLIDKPAGPTSHDIVGQVRRVLGEKKVGHLGTLDPAATGLMVLAVGAKALKVVELYNHLEKEYEADVLFGAVSTTYDREGAIEEVARKPGVAEPNKHDVMLAMQEKFAGAVWQVPPMHSAIWLDGQRAYKKARDGQDVAMPKRQVTIDACEVLQFDYPKLTLRVACSSGTYIRSIAHDLGTVLRCGAYLSGLRRTKVGDWCVQNAVATADATWGNVVPLKEILHALPRLEVTEEEFEHITHGRAIQQQVQPDTIAWFNGLPIAILEPLKDGSNAAKGRKVF